MLFIDLFVHLFIYSCIYLFIYSFIFIVGSGSILVLPTYNILQLLQGLPQL